MRLLKINDYIVEIDDKTAIGVDVHGLDLTKPKDRYVNNSNAFTIPRTINNLKAIGFVGGIPNSQPTIYDNFSVQYFLNNEVVIDGAYVVIQEISERIKLNIVRKPTLWDEMKSLQWDDFINDYFDYLVANHNVPDFNNPIIETQTEWINRWLDNANGALRYYPAYTNEMDYLGLDYLAPRTNTFQLERNVSSSIYLGGHFWSDAKTLFLFIQDKYSIDFDIGGLNLDNAFLNTSFLNTIWNIRNLRTQLRSFQAGSDREYAVIVGNTYAMQNDVSENDGGSLYGLMYSILNIHGIVVENYDTNKYRLRDISYDIQNRQSRDIGLNLEDVKTSKIVPFIKGYGQESIIKHSSYADGITSVNTRKIVECNNKNIQYRKTLIKIENFIPAYKDTLMNYGVDKSFEQYKIATWEEESNTYDWYYSIDAGYNELSSITKSDYKKVVPIDLSDKWAILDEALQDPLFIEAKCWLTPTQYSKINNWTLYYIPQFSGAYYINKVKGYNPEKSQQAVKLELIRINNNTPK